jgi:hypothetical protein
MLCATGAALSRRLRRRGIGGRCGATREALSRSRSGWPYAGAVSVCERDLLGERSDVRVPGLVLAGTARDDASLPR